ncbi:MAG: type IV pilus modification PilV family protein [Nevskiales bacterium]
MGHRYSKPLKLSGQDGFSLIEILITLVVISIGVLGHMSFQKVVYRDTGLAATRNVAAELGVTKLEDLRGFSVLETEIGRFAFEDIGSNSGGSLPNGNITVGNTEYTRSWTATDYYYVTDLAVPTTTVPAGSPLPDFKQVTVTIGWMDTTGVAQSWSVSTHIAAVDPSIAARIYY